MIKAGSFVSVLVALICAAAVPAVAQVVVGGPDDGPDVQVNWSVLNHLGPRPTLPGMLEKDVAADVAAAGGRAGHAAAHHAGAAHAAGTPVLFRPYRPHRAGRHHVRPHHTRRVRHLRKRESALHPADKVAVHAVAMVRTAPLPVKASQPAKAPRVAEAPHAAAKGPHLAAKGQTAPVVAASHPAQPAAKAPAAPKLTQAGPTPVPPAPVQPADLKVAGAVPAATKAAAMPVSILPAAVSQTVPAAHAAPPAVAAPRAVPAPPAVKEAAGPSSPALMHGDVLTVVFTGESVNLPDGARPSLSALARRMEKDRSVDLQLMAYAKADPDNFGKAHRVSLSRALEVRRFLMEQGVRSTRIDVRPLGAKLKGGGPVDRVDAVLVAR